MNAGRRAAEWAAPSSSMHPSSERTGGAAGRSTKSTASHFSSEAARRTQGWWGRESSSSWNSLWSVMFRTGLLRSTSYSVRESIRRRTWSRSVGTAVCGLDVTGVPLEVRGPVERGHKGQSRDAFHVTVAGATSPGGLLCQHLARWRRSNRGCGPGGSLLTGRRRRRHTRGQGPLVRASPV